MDPRWLILADDLTGAADSAIAFARRRLPAKVVWGDARAQDHEDVMALAYDAATRELDAPSAAQRHRDVLRRFLIPGVRVFKKIDSTLRGHPAEEIAAMLDVILAFEPRARTVIATAYPATGRTVRGGLVLVAGVPLPFTEFWPANRDPELANVVTLLESAGVPAYHHSSAAFTPSRGVAVCDAETEHDLELIAAAALADDVPTFCVGSAGFAHALAQVVSRASARRSVSQTSAVKKSGALLVIGSRSQATRAALARLLSVEQVKGVSVNPLLLNGDLLTAAHAAIAETVADSLASGIDVVVDIEPSASFTPGGNPKLVSALARLLSEPARQASALVATGGETASALLARLGIKGIRLVDEIEPGIPLGLTLGEVSIPVVTKAGGFGNEDCLKRILSRLRFIRNTGAVA